MFDDLASIFYNNVVSAYNDYTAYRDGNVAGRDHHLRSSTETATALYHFREHLPTAQKMSRAQVERQCADFRLIADVANATKHGFLTKGVPLVKSAQDVQEEIVITLYSDNEGEYSHARTLIQAKCTDGLMRNLDSALTEVLNYWGEKLKGWNIAEYVRRPAPEAPGIRYLNRSEASNLNFQLLYGLRFKHQIRLQKFDALQGRAEPIDLTGHKVQFRIFKPAYDFVVECTSFETGQKVQVPIALSDEESTIFYGLENDDERQSYFKRFAQEHRAELESAAARIAISEAKTE